MYVSDEYTHIPPHMHVCSRLRCVCVCICVCVLVAQLCLTLFNEYSGLISFRIDWLDLLAVQGTLKSLLQHHSLKHQFFGAQPFLLSSCQVHT